MDTSKALFNSATLHANHEVLRSAESFPTGGDSTVSIADDAEAYYRRGVILQQSGEREKARVAYLQALRLRPQFVPAMSDLAVLYMDCGDLRTAEVLLQEAVRLQPAFLAAHENLGSVLARQGKALAALDSLRQVLSQDPHNVAALCTLGYVLDTLGDEEGSRACCERVLLLQPDSAVARFNRSSHLLREGNFIDGWRDYEARWKVRQYGGTPRDLKGTRWHGEPVKGRCIYIYAEQGFGDTLQFARYALMLVRMGARVLLEVQPALQRLLEGLHPAVHVVIPGEALPFSYDLHCPLLSLAKEFGTDLNSIPDEVPYIVPGAEVLAKWRPRFQQSKFRVGLVWSGNPDLSREGLRSIPMSQFAKVLHAPGAVFYSLQKGQAAKQLAENGLQAAIHDLDEDLQDFSDTAAVIAHLHLVITVDTAVAHLAGAMGKPVWILLPRSSDWRWLRDRVDSPWYPTAGLFRQTVNGRWDDTLDEVQNQLAVLAAAYNVQD